MYKFLNNGHKNNIKTNVYIITWGPWNPEWISYKNKVYSHIYPIIYVKWTNFTFINQPVFKEYINLLIC